MQLAQTSANGTVTALIAAGLVQAVQTSGTGASFAAAGLVVSSTGVTSGVGATTAFSAFGMLPYAGGRRLVGDAPGAMVRGVWTTLTGDAPGAMTRRGLDRLMTSNAPGSMVREPA